MARVLEGRNRATADEAASFVSELDRIEQNREVKLAELDAEFKKRKRDLNKQFDGDQAGIYEDAKKQGVAKGTLRAIIAGQARIRKAEEKVDAAKERAADGIADLEDENRDFAIDIVKALGSDFAGFGLGAAAVERAEGEPKQDPATAAIVKSFADGKAEKAAKAPKH